MKNLADVDQDKLDSLPSRMSTHRHNRDGEAKGCGCSWCDERKGEYVPYGRINRWLASCVGMHINAIVHEFTHVLDWVPVEHRTFHDLCGFVETHTFMRDDKVMFYASRYHDNAEQSVVDVWEEVFYVHPRTGQLKHKPRNTRIRWSNRQAKELATYFIKLGDYDQLIKLDGIWYHCWADAQNPRIPKCYDSERPLIYDERIKKKMFHGPMDPRWNEYLYFLPKVHKAQLSREQLKQRGLSNDVLALLWRHCKVCGAKTYGSYCARHTT